MEFRSEFITEMVLDNEKIEERENVIELEQAVAANKLM